ncbi:hypothetical protein [Hyphococcus sp.]|uniref:hypothetical protein n=1 Tax=Hyphococcus sp. TaxID=2038636 RepID=UPI00208BB2E3|nr:MAG: hypothetical protein DHS20C04_31240 [Marinicaulis sp.]
MKYLPAILAAAFIAGPAVAQISAPAPEIDSPVRKLPGGVKLPDVLAPGQHRAAGCIKQQLYNIQSVSGYSVSFTVATSEGDRLFNLEGDAIRYIPDGTPLPLATTAQTLKWTRFLDTLERAAATRRSVLVDYATPSRKVFGVYIQWENECAD